jgi:hypothetical protein
VAHEFRPDIEDPRARAEALFNAMRGEMPGILDFLAISTDPEFIRRVGEIEHGTRGRITIQRAVLRRLGALGKASTP